MWQAVVASWLMAMTSGQLELNAPQNAVQPTETVVQPAVQPPVQPAWKPAADDPDDQPVLESPPKPAIDTPKNEVGKPALIKPELPALRPDLPAKAIVDRVPLNLNSKTPQPVIRDFQPAAKYLPPVQNNTADANTGPSLPKPILTKQMYFSLPARSGATQNNSQIVEVQLFVSPDKGANWSFYSRVKPDQARIPFRTAADGEYWFATRTLDRSGKFEPQNVSTPTVIVEIDNKPPIILLSADSASGGQVSARWEISDLHLKPDSLTLQYRTSTGGPWQPVALSDKDSSISDTNQSGETTWWPTPGTKEVVVRAEVSDAMGNKGVAHAQVKLNSGGTSASNLAKKDAARTKGEESGLKAEVAKANPKIGNQYQAADASALTNNPYYAYLPPSETPRMINSRVFELDYDLQAVGPSGVSRVELFGTRDGGRTWRSFGIDSDNRSPMTVRVDEEGLYGFQIVITSGAGLGDPPPKSGEQPSIWIGVDLTRPTAKITSADFGSGDDEGKLVIVWEASDKMIGEKPVTLSYSAQPGGPFTPFASNLENTGRYVWTFDSKIPPIVYLRLEVVDEAGNRTTIDYPRSIPLDRSRPTGRIRDVRAAGQ